MKKIISLLLIASIFLTGCASRSPNPIPVAQVGDETKSCNAITNEMQQMVDAKLIAEGDGNTQVGKNVALGITGVFLIVPWFFMDLGNASTIEQRAAQARFQRLQQMAVDKKCSGVPVMRPDVPADPINDNLSASDSTGDAAQFQPISSGLATISNPSTTPKVTSDSGAAKINLANPAKRLEDLMTLLNKGLITQKEYDVKKDEILKNL